jgi:hypothetical protein
MAQLCERLESTNSSNANAGQSTVNEVISEIEREFLRVHRALEAERFPAANDS